MGGTTAKAAMIEGGRFDRVGELDVGAGINFAARLLKGGGYHVSVPAIDIAEVGAGWGQPRSHRRGRRPRGRTGECRRHSRPGVLRPGRERRDG